MFIFGPMTSLPSFVTIGAIVEPDQVWYYRDSTSYSWPTLADDVTLKDAIDNSPNEIASFIVLEVKVGVASTEIEVEFIKSDLSYCPWGVGEKADFHKTDFSDAVNFRILSSSDGSVCYSNEVVIKPPPIVYGTDCDKCKKHYPHAAKVIGFTCWACRNGY